MRGMNDWDVRNLPAFDGRCFVVTGASSGIGYFVAEQLATTNAHVVLTGRTNARLEAATTSIRQRMPNAQLSTLTLDLADFASIHAAVNRLADFTPGVDGAVFNAGVLAQESRRTTADGHELVYGTNYLGHFLLTSLLLPTLNRGARLVTIGSVAARAATLDLADLNAEQAPYRGFDVYKRSKLAQTVFAFELDRRLRHSESSAQSLVAHPGGALDGLTPNRAPIHVRRPTDIIRALPRALILQGKDTAAWPAVRALLDPRAEGGQLWGPRVLRAKGRPVLERPTPRMLDRNTASQLWTISASATATRWPTAGSPGPR
jgi:NAD(P)-dependent dehydrogenase (short-subunit alcohol dehydrogenase family)